MEQHRTNQYTNIQVKKEEPQDETFTRRNAELQDTLIRSLRFREESSSQQQSSQQQHVDYKIVSKAPKKSFANKSFSKNSFGYNSYGSNSLGSNSLGNNSLGNNSLGNNSLGNASTSYGTNSSNYESYESFASMKVTILNEIPPEIVCAKEVDPNLRNSSTQHSFKEIPVLEGEIPLTSQCFKEWKTVIGCEKKIDSAMFEFSLQDTERQRMTFEKGILLLQSNSQFKFPALQIFIEKFSHIHQKRVERRIKAEQSYSKPSVLHEFISEFQKQFVKRTDKVVQTLIDSSPGFLITLRCRWNIEARKHELYKIGLSGKFIQLLGADPDIICYDFMKNGIRNLFDEESLLNLSSVLICYHMTKCLQERKQINVHLKTYDGLLLPTICSIQFHAEKMDGTNAYFESIVTLNFFPDSNFFPTMTQFRANLANKLLQSAPTNNDTSTQRREAFKVMAPINLESLENNKLILQKFYGFSFAEDSDQAKTCRIKYI